MSYKDQYKDPRWQKKRLGVMERDSFTCTSCREKGKTLHVHHRYYVFGRSVWEYPKWSLISLCEDCHAAISVKNDYDKCHGVAKELEEWEIAIESLGEGYAFQLGFEKAERAFNSKEAHAN